MRSDFYLHGSTSVFLKSQSRQRGGAGVLGKLKSEPACRASVPCCSWVQFTSGYVRSISPSRVRVHMALARPVAGEKEPLKPGVKCNTPRAIKGTNSFVQGMKYPKFCALAVATPILAKDLSSGVTDRPGTFPMSPQLQWACASPLPSPLPRICG